MIEGINYLILLVLIAVASAAICVRRSPKAMTAIAAWLVSTAEADEARAEYHRKRHAAWRRQLGISEGPQLVRGEEREA